VKTKITQTKNAITKGLDDCEESLGSSSSKLSEVLARMEARLRAPVQRLAG
jgi:hypothetical protein